MADLTARFRLIDELSDKLASMADKGQQMLSAFEDAGSAASSAFGDMEDGLHSAVTSADGVASSIEDMGNAAEEAASSTDVLVDSMSQYEDAAGKAADAQEELAKQTEETADTAEDAGKTGTAAVQGLASALAAAGITQAVKEIAGAFLEASDAAAVFEDATMKISTIADTEKVSLSTISGDIMELSRDTGRSVLQLSDAAYSALSASVDTASAVEFTGTATKLAAGGFTSSATAVDVLTTALNAYGLEASEAGSISDMLITTQNLGKTTVDELASSVGKVIPLASAYGLQMDNLSAAYAELTKGGIATAESTTYLKGMLTELGDSGSTVAGILEEQTGMGFADLIEAGYSLGDVLNVLGTAVGGNATEFSNLWSSTEAGIGALALFNAGAEQFNATLEAMQNSVGATQQAYDTMTNTTAHAKEELANAAENLSISIGQVINPLIQKLYEGGTNILNFMSEFTQEHPVVAKAVTSIAVGLGVAAVAVAGFAAATTVVIPAVTALGATISAALWPITAVAAGVTALTAALFFLVDGFEEDLGATEGMTAATREQYYAVQDLNEQYDEAVEKYGENSEEALRLKYQMDDLSASFEANRQTVEQFTAEIDTLCTSVSDLSTQYDQSITSINTEETSALSLIQKLEDLASQSDRTAVQQKELEALTNKLALSYPELGLSIESVTDNTEGMVDAMKKACEQQAEQQRLQQAEDTYIQALQKRQELTDKIAKAQENINLEQERMDGMSGWTHFWTGGEWDDLKAYQAALEELQAAEDENNATIAEIEQQWQDIADAEAEAAEETMSYEEAVSTAYESVNEELEELCKAYDEAYEAAKSSLEGQFGLFEEASMSSEEYKNSTVANAQEALESQLAYWDSYLANVQALKDTSAEDLGITQENYQLLMSYVQDGSAEATGLANSMVQAIQSGNTEAVAELANTAGEVQSRRETIAEETADWQTNFNSTMDELVEKMDATVEGLNLDSEAAASAKATIDAYAEQIRTSGGSAVEAAQSIAEQVSNALNGGGTTVSVGTAVPGHAGGTTNAEGAFIAGERGHELIVRSAEAYAGGTTDSTGYYLAGENGPELIIGQQGSTVFPTEETDRILSALDERSRPLNIISGTGESGDSGGRMTAGETIKRIILEIAGSGSIGVGGSGTDTETILGILQEHLRPVLMSLIQSEIYEEGDLSYEY